MLSLSTKSSQLSDLQWLKFKIMSRGLKIDEKIRALVGSRIKDAISMRSGLSSGLDMILPNNTWVNAPINEWFANQSELELGLEGNNFVLKRNGRWTTEVELLPRPSYYDRCTSDGVPMRAIGSTRGDRLSIAITNSCVFWENERQRCKFCAIGYSTKNEIKTKKVEQILETVEAALHDPVLPARHVYLSSGSMPGPDRGAKLFSQIVSEIKSNFTVHVHLNPCPPRYEKYVDDLYRSGLDEISFNVEVADERIAKHVIPGKFKSIGLDHHHRMLSYAVRLFGERRVSSCLVVGLEHPVSTVRGVEHLARLGVVPKLSCFRPIVGSLLCNSQPPSMELMEFVYLHSRETVMNYGIPLGPLCVPCQLHSLVFPEKRSGHYYS